MRAYDVQEAKNGTTNDDLNDNYYKKIRKNY